MKIKVRNCSKNYCLSTLNTASEGKFEGKFEAADREKTALDSLDRVDQNHLTEKDDNDNDTLREVPHQSNEGLALQARVSGPWPL